MSTFPRLKTGSVMQFPASRTTRFSTDIVQFLDGSEQRFCDYGAPVHRWIVNLDRLDETELQNIRLFAERQNGTVGVFSFVDPWDQKEYDNCSFEDEGVSDGLNGPMRGQAKLTIRENRA